MPKEWAPLSRGERPGEFDAVQGVVGDALGQVVAQPVDQSARHGRRTDDLARGVAAHGPQLEPLVGAGESLGRIGAGRVRQRGGGQCRGEAVERGDDAPGEDGRRSATQHTCVARGGTEERDLAHAGRVDGQDGTCFADRLVVREHEGAAGDPAGEGFAVDPGGRLGHDRFGAFEGAGAGGEPQDVAHGVVHLRFFDLAGANGGGEGLAVHGLRVGHGHVEAAVDGTGRPVGVQSETLTPSKPHTPRRTSLTR